MAAQEGISLREYLRNLVGDQAKDTKDDASNPIDLEAYLDEAAQTIEDLSAQDQALYQRLGLANDTFAICGVGPRFDERITGAQRGWGPSIEDMARLGLPPVRYEGPGAYEQNPAFRHWLIQLRPEECLP